MVCASFADISDTYYSFDVSQSTVVLEQADVLPRASREPASRLALVRLRNDGCKSIILTISRSCFSPGILISCITLIPGPNTLGALGPRHIRSLASFTAHCSHGLGRSITNAPILHDHADPETQLLWAARTHSILSVVSYYSFFLVVSTLHPP